MVLAPQVADGFELGTDNGTGLALYKGGKMGTVVSDLALT